VQRSNYLSRPGQFKFRFSLFKQLKFQAHLSQSVVFFTPVSPISLTLHHLDFHYYFSMREHRVQSWRLAYWTSWYHIIPVRWSSVQAKIQLLDKFEYFKILNSECCLGSIQPGPAHWFLWRGPARPVWMHQFLGPPGPPGPRATRAAGLVGYPGRPIHMSET